MLIQKNINYKLDMPKRREENRQNGVDQDDSFDEFDRMRDHMLYRQRNFGKECFFDGFERRMLKNFEDFGAERFNDFDRRENGVDTRDNRGRVFDPSKEKGHYAMQSMTKKTFVDSDGKERTKKTINDEASTIGSDGQRIVTKNSMFKDSGKGIKKIERERRLGNRRYKVTREVHRDDSQEYKTLENMDYEDVDDFNREFDRQAKDTGLDRFKEQVDYRRRPLKKRSYKPLQ